MRVSCHGFFRLRSRPRKGMKDDGVYPRGSERTLARVGEGARARRPENMPHPRRAGSVHRAGAPVLRDSIEAGTFEDLFLAVPAPGEPDRLLRACRRALDAGRRPRREERVGTRTLTAAERAIAALTAGAVHVYEEICALARLNQSRVFPSYDSPRQPGSVARRSRARCMHSTASVSSSASVASSGWKGRSRITARRRTPIVCSCRRAYSPICCAGCDPCRCRTIRFSMRRSGRSAITRCWRHYRVATWRR